MKVKDFRKKYFYVAFADLKQKTIDTIEDVVGELEDSDSNIGFEIRKGSVHYDIDTLLEVMDNNLEDYKLLSEMLDDLETLEEDER